MNCAAAENGSKVEEETDAEREAQAQSRQQVQRLLDPRTGASVLLPEGFGWDWVGSGDVEAYEGTPTPPCLASYDPVTAAVTVSSTPAVCTRLQRYGVVQPVCRPLRGELLKENRLESNGDGFAYEGGRLARVTRDLKHIVLQRCHRRPIVLAGPVEPTRHVKLQGPEGAPPTRQALQPGVPSSFDLRDGLLTWDIGFSYYAFDESADAIEHGSLSAYRLNSGMRRTWQLPSLPMYIAGEKSPRRGVFGYSGHTAHTVFWIPTRDVSNEGRESLCCVEDSYVYAARF